MASNERAAPDGWRRPCSHSCNVRGDTPSSSANRCLDSPERSRASAMPETVTRVARPTLPDFICRTDASNSAPRFRLVSLARSARSVIFGIQRAPDLAQRSSVDVVAHAFGIDQQQIDRPFRQPVVVDDADPAALASPRSRPANLATTARVSNHITSLRVGDEPADKLCALILVPVVRPNSAKQRRFNNREEGGSLRQCRILRQRRRGLARIDRNSLSRS
jgi:hypothetical protein